MGSWFSNFHIRKNNTITENNVTDYFLEIMTREQYIPAACEEEADGAFAIITDEKSQWFSVYSDLISFDDPSLFADFATPLSEGFKTDILGISCFDSDYLYLNLINSEENIDAWIGIGSASGLGIKRRSRLSAWKKKVSEHKAFSECASKKYVCAEDFLTEAEQFLALPAVHSTASYEYLEDFDLDKKAKYFYFKLPDDMKTKEPVKLVPFLRSNMPCFLEKHSAVNCINVGGEARGLSVYFLGPYVENDEITFSDTCFAKSKNNGTESVPFTLTKIQLPDGQWAYHYHDPGFRIPPKVDDRLSMSKRLRAMSEKSIIVRFVPHGNHRKILDITVVLVPDKNPEGQTGWNVWHGWGSKKAFIEHYNAIWDKHRDQRSDPNALPPILKEEDFD